MRLMLSSYKSLLSVALSATLLAGMTSCQDEDFGYTAQEIAYKTNFEKVYGKIPADKSWDLSSWANWKAPVSSSKTRAEGGTGNPTKGKLVENTHFSVGSSYYEVPNNLLSWLNGHLLEGNDNRFLGSSFVFKVPNNDFAIIPIYQGNSAIHGELEIKINDYEITKIWEKSSNMQAVPKDGNEWQDVLYWDGYTDLHHPNQAIKDGKLWPTPVGHGASTIGDKQVRSKPIVFHKNQIGSDDFMYLSVRNTAKSPVPQGATGKWSDDGKSWITTSYKTEKRNDLDSLVTSMWDSNNTWTTIGDRLTSINPDGYMLALSVPMNQRPASQPLADLVNYDLSNGDVQVMVVGCEDANGKDSDHDINDIVFLVVGYPEIPQVIHTTQVIKKRYLCEDLGATDDFDFNDIVVDVSQTMNYQMTYNPSSVDLTGFFNDKTNPSAITSVEIANMIPQNGDNGTPDTRVQTARISHVCGSLPIQVQVGDYMFPWIMDPTDLQATRQDLMKGGWKWNDGAWSACDRVTPTRAAYEVREEGWNPNEERVITGWVPEANNIRIYVQWPEKMGTPKSDNNPEHQETSGNELLAQHNWAASNPYIADAFHTGQEDFLDFVQGDRHVANVTFPLKGTVPYIIAADPDFPWMKERKDVLRKWLTNGKYDTNDPEYANVAGPGSGAYYEIIEGEGIDRAIIWSGKSGGERLVNGVELKAGTAEQLGIEEAIGQGYNTINVYTSGVANGYVGLCYIDSDGSWKTLYALQDADSYKADVIYTAGSETWYKASIRLTQNQMNAIKGKGFVLQSYTNALFLRALDLTKNDGYTVKLSDPALDTEANNNSVMGVITAADRARERNEAEAGGRIPFAEAMYANSENCVLTAEPRLGYVFDYWSDDNSNTDAERTINSSNAPADAFTAIFHFQAPAASVNLESKYYHKWSSYLPGAHISSPNRSGASSVIDEESQFDESRKSADTRGAVYGGVNVIGDEYADLSNSNVLVMTAPKANNYRFVFNRESNDGNGSEFLVLNSSEKGAKYLTVHVDGEVKTIIVDLAAIKRDKGYVHLNCIKNAAMTNHVANSIKVDVLPCNEHAAFATLCSDWNSARYNGQSEPYNTLNNALRFYRWSSDAANASIVGEGTRQALVATKSISASGGICATLLGNTWNQANIYADLSHAYYMAVEVSSVNEVPRFWFNNQSLTFLGTDNNYCRIYKGGYGRATHYVVNLKKICDEKGYAHLNSITTDYSGSVKLTNVYVNANADKAVAWDAAMSTVAGKTWYNSQIPYTNSDSDTNFGNPDGYSDKVNLSEYHWMKITLQPKDNGGKDIRLYFNANSGTDRLEIDINQGKNTKYLFVKDNIWYVDLDAIKTDQGKVELHAIKGPTYGTSAQINGIQLDGQAVAKRTLTLSCNDSDYNLFINGNQVSSAEVAAGSRVTVKALNPNATAKMKEDNVYCFSWSGVTGLADSFDNDERSFDMPDANTTLTITPLYKLQPQTHLGSIAKYDNSLGDITTTWNGKTSQYTRPIYVPNGSLVQATYTEKPGYAFKVWKYSGSKKDNPYTVTKNDDKTAIDYAPQAEYVEAGDGHKWTDLSVDFNNSGAKSYNINKPGDGMNAIGILFDNVNVDKVSLFCDTWIAALQDDIKVTNGYVVIRLTDASLTAINAGTQPFIQIFGAEGADLSGTKIIAVYEFQL